MMRIGTKANRAHRWSGLLVGSLVALAIPGSSAAAAPLVTPIPTSHEPVDVSISANGSIIAYETLTRNQAAAVYEWTNGHSERIDTPSVPSYYSGLFNGGGTAISGDGKWIAYAALDHGRPGIVFYDTNTHARSFLSGYVLDVPSLGQGNNAQAMTTNGQELLVAKGTNEAHPTPFGIYNRQTRRFTPLPSRKGYGSYAFNLSPNGTEVLYGELKPYAGQKFTVLYNEQTHHQVTLPWRSEQIHWLSEDGMFALTDGGPNEANWVTRYDLSTESTSGPVSGKGISFNGARNDSATLSGNGQVIELDCATSIYEYSFTTGTYSLVLANYPHLQGSSLSSNGSTVILMSPHGLGVVPTARATTVSALPTPCETL